MKTFTKICLSVSLMAVFLCGNFAQAQTASLDGVNLLSNGGFEADVPAYWTPEGDGAEWSTEQYRTPSYSLKLSGSGAASWAQNEAVRNWTPGIPAGGTPELILGGYVYTEGVNTSPSGDSEKFQLVYEFFDAEGTDVLGAPVVIDVPQDVASSDGWVEINSESLGAITLPTEQAAKSVKISFRKGADATGTVYLEDIYIRAAEGAEGWAGDWFNPSMDMGDTWYYWYPMSINDPDSLDFTMSVTDEEAHTGEYSLRVEQLNPAASEAVSVSDRVPVTGDEPVLVSFWVKYSDVTYPDSIGKGDNNIGITALYYNNLEAGAAGYGEIGGSDIRLNGEYNDRVIPLATRTTDSEWKQYAFVIYPVADAVGMEVRLRYWHAFEGVVYWDDVFIAPISEMNTNVDDLLSNGGFEADVPAYWTPEGDGAEWSTEQYRTPSYSLKLSGSGAASWAQNEAVRNWTPGIPAGGTPELILGGYVYTEGVNTSPSGDSEKFQLVYEFFDAEGTDVLGAPVVIDVPQDVASSDGWVEINSESLGAITLPTEQAAKSVKISFRKGADATGTVYLEDIYIRAAEGAEGWAGDWFNPSMDMGDTWYYWYPMSINDPDSLDFTMSVTDEEAHTGEYSLRVEQLNPAASEAVSVSDRVPVTGDEPVLVSFWVKYSDVTYPDSIGKGDNNIGITALYYNNLEAGAAGYGEIGGSDIRLNGEYNDRVIPLATRTTDSEWKQYAFVIYPVADAVGMEVRLRYWHAFEGVVYWDDVMIQDISGLVAGTLVSNEVEDVSTITPGAFHLKQNYPNPFNPTTKITFELSRAENVNLSVFNMLGQKVADVITNRKMSSGLHTIDFSAHNLPSGVYLYRLTTDNFSEIRRMTLIK